MTTNTKGTGGIDDAGRVPGVGAATEGGARIEGSPQYSSSDGPGQGSEFVVRLPLLEWPARPSAPPVETRPGLNSTRVLVVDDNEDSAESLGMLLRSLGADVRTVNDGLSALALVEEFKPDVVLLDIGMPGMDGYEVARRIRDRADNRELMLIALTGWGQEEDRRRSFRAGFDHHLVKPTDIDALRALMGSRDTGEGRPPPTQH